MKCRLLHLCCLLASCGMFVLGIARAEEKATVEARLLDAARHISSDEMQGRGVGTDGLNLAADYLAAEFKKLGLKTELYDGSPFQKFTLTIGAELGSPNELAFVAPPAKEGEAPRELKLKMGQEFMPLALGGSGKFDLPLVFVGYGITAKKEGYDDYAGIDVKDKAVVVLRRSPQQGNPHAPINSTNERNYTPFFRKISNAYEHGAAAVIFVNDEFDNRRNALARQKRWQETIDKLVEESNKFKQIELPTLSEIQDHYKRVDALLTLIKSQGDTLATQFDPLLQFATAGNDNQGRNFPVLHIRRAALDLIFKASGNTTLAALEKEIDNGPTPKSQELGWRIKGEVNVKRKQADVKNVLAVLEGEGDLAQETLVIGAHYDHVGMGGPGSGSLDPTSRDVHNGADDNGSGTVTLLEIARQLSTTLEKKPRRRIVFMCFTGEERGLLGSAYYTNYPLFKLEDTVAMLNLDMVGRLTDEKLIIQGVDTSPEFGPLVDKSNERHGFKITRQSGGLGPSDHASFYSKKIPVMHFFTDLHKDYHRPADDYDKLNIVGMRRIGEMVTEIATALAEAPKRPTYIEVGRSTRGGGGDADRPYFGSIPDFAQNKPGYALSGVSKGGPADKAGIKGGDIIIQLGESKIGNLEDFDSALRKYKPGEKVIVTVKRDGQDVKLEVTLDKAPAP